MDYSINPDVEKFHLPDEEDYRQEYEKLIKLIHKQKEQDREIVVAMGLGFVGAVMAGAPLAVVDCFGILDDNKIERYFELGCEVKGLGPGPIDRIKDKARKRKPDS